MTDFRETPGTPEDVAARAADSMAFLSDVERKAREACNYEISDAYQNAWLVIRDQRATIERLERQNAVGLSNLRDAWAAINRLREEVETRSGGMVAPEHTGPEFGHEAEQIARGVILIYDRAIAAETTSARLEQEMLAWRICAQEITPGGSEFMSPEAVHGYQRELKNRYHAAKCEAALLRKELAAKPAAMELSDHSQFARKIVRLVTNASGAAEPRDALIELVADNLSTYIAALAPASAKTAEDRE